MKRILFSCSHEGGCTPHNELMKPGFTRLNLSYFASEEEVNYLLNALEFIAEEGWKFSALVKQHLFLFLNSIKKSLPFF